MADYKSIESEYKKEFLMSMFDSVLANANESVRDKCMEYGFNPEVEIPKDVQKALDLVDVVRSEYNAQLDALRDKYEVRLKMAMAILVNEIDRVS
jgi:hypothetical protein